MGIKGLKDLIKKHSSDSITPIKLNFLKNKILCIDSSILLYKFRYSIQNDNFHIIGFLQKTLELLEFGIIPIYIFDGKPPDAKQNVLKKRSEIKNKSKERLDELNLEKNNYSGKFKNSLDFLDEIILSDDENILEIEELNLLKKNNKEIEKIQKNTLYVNKIHSVEVMELLKSIGISFYESQGEAEEMCAFLQKNKIADYILTEDTDSLTFGGDNIIFNTKNNYCLCKIQNVLDGFELNFNEFVDLCILCGCDYTCSIPKLGPNKALVIIKKYKSIENFITNNKIYVIPTSFNYIEARFLFYKNNEFNLTLNLNKNEFNKNEFNKNLIKFNLI